MNEIIPVHLKWAWIQDEAVISRTIIKGWCKISVSKILFLFLFFSGLKRKPGGRADSPSDNAKPRPSEGSESGKH